MPSKSAAPDQFDVVVVGGGHAGIEAAVAASRMGMKVAMVTLDKNHIGNMPCNPSVGGPAKGVVTREIDALGGVQGEAADATALQMKMLNESKGPGVWALRCQSDKIEYKKFMLQKVLASGVTIVESEVLDVLVEQRKAAGVLTGFGRLAAKAVILTTGTYLRSVTMRGASQKREGPDGQKNAEGLSQKLIDLGFRLIRLKTGTPPRLLANSIDYSQLQIEGGSPRKLSFSHNPKTYLDLSHQLPCYLLHTNEKTHEIVRKNLHLCSMQNGLVTGTGARYCPSVEDKVFRFADKPRHQLFVEPESVHLDTVYLGGFSTSMPEEVQEQMIRTLPGMANAVVARYSYAIEYDAIDPVMLALTLEAKILPGLYAAGQINGTSGYEEAACQGLMAGINAALKIKGEPPLVLTRAEAYIGVLIDDLTGKGVLDPYRLLTSRAEYRLHLRNDNAQQRLIAHGRRVGLVSDERFAAYEHRMAAVANAEHALRRHLVTARSLLGQRLGLKAPAYAYELLRRTEVTVEDFAELHAVAALDPIAAEQLSIHVKFAGYIEAQERAIAALPKSETAAIPAEVDYKKVANLSLEAREKLAKFRPSTIGQAARISGISPSDVTMLLLHIKKTYGRDRA